MAIFSRKEKNTVPTFAERLSIAKSVFKKAYDDATVLNTELEGEIEMKQKEVDYLKVVQNDTLSFISNIAHIVQ